MTQKALLKMNEFPCGKNTVFSIIALYLSNTASIYLSDLSCYCMTKPLIKLCVNLILSLLVIILMNACNQEKKQEILIQQELVPLHQLKKTPIPGEWLAEHKEKYQSFEAYVKNNPSRLQDGRDKIYIVRIGKFSTAELQIVSKTARYLWLFYGLQVKYMDLPDSTNFLKQSRERQETGIQLSAGYILNDILIPILPADAVVLIGLTNYDLYPRPDWNYVFGMASLRNGVGVWSMNRFGDPSNSVEFDKCFQRTIRTATHEIGHMFSIRHCVKYECCMNGSNNLFEMDNRPTYFCPDCLRKLSWNLKQDMSQNLTRVRSFWVEEKNYKLVQFYDRSIQALAKN